MYIKGLKMNPELGFKYRVFQHWIWPCNWPSVMTLHFYSAMLQGSHHRLIYLQHTRASHKMGAVQIPRGKNPKLKVLNPRIDILDPKNLSFLALALSLAIKVTELQTSGKKVD